MKPNKDKLFRLENKWNNRCNAKSESILSKKVFAPRSLSPTPSLSVVEELKPAYSSITEALGFVHHIGTDRNIELQIIKCILKRESLILKLMSLCEASANNNNLPKLSVAYDKSSFDAKLLDSMSQTRDLAVSYVELLCSWRMTSRDFNPQQPRPFIWEGGNYTLKMVSDLNFMSECPFLLNSLEIPHSRLVSNPLMLSNSLFDSSGMDSSSPYDRAVKDSHGETEGPLFNDRMRLREAERVILQEIEFQQPNLQNGSYSTASVKSDIDKSIPPFPPSISHSFVGVEDSKSSWLGDAQAQIRLLESLQGEALASSSTTRLDKIFKKKPLWVPEPTKLSAIDSTLLYHSRPNTSSNSPSKQQSSRSRLQTAEGKKKPLPSLSRAQSSTDSVPESNDPSVRSEKLRVGVDDDSSTADIADNTRAALQPLKEIAYVDSEDNSIYSLEQAGKVVLTKEDLVILSSISNPAKPVTLAAAVTAIVVHEDPKQVSFDK